MASELTLYQVPPSPNNIKIRIALGYKSLPYGTVDTEVKSVPPAAGERAEVVKVSGQPLTPVLVHDDRVIFGSPAILRYLDANFPATPRLFSADYVEMKEIETWETFARNELMVPLSLCFGQATSGQEDPETLAQVRHGLEELTGRLEERLAGTGWLVGNRMTAADVTAVPYLHYCMLPEGTDASGPILGFLDRHMKLPQARDRVREWVDRVRAYDRWSPHD
jgi:glutathione S-transferase